MEAPYTIASLPKPLDDESGRIQTAPVYGLRSSRKRKRHEVAVGIDGEGVNIYNVLHSFVPFIFQRLLKHTTGSEPVSHYFLRSPPAVVSVLSAVFHLLPTG